MKHLSDALNMLHEDCAWFVRAREVRLLIVRTSGDVRSTVTKLTPRYEFLADNRSPWVLMEDAYEAETAYWESRAARLLQDWERRREAFARDGTALGRAVPRQPVDTSLAATRPGLDHFFNASVAVLDALQPPLDGIVLVMAPTIVNDSERLSEDLVALFARQEFARARIVLVLDVDVPLPVTVVDALGPGAIVCECITDPEQKRRDFEALVNPGGNGPPVPGAAPVGVTPPRRVNAPPELDPAVRDAALREAGINPAYLERAPELRRLVLNAALAMGDAKGDEAIRLQSQAVRLCRELDLAQMMVICQITLASYLSGSGDRPRALEELAAAAAAAAKHGLKDQESQAWLAQGLLHNLERRSLDAADAYYHAAKIAESANAGILAIEAWRLAAQAALDAGETDHGVHYLRKALKVGGELEPPARSQTSAAEVARTLAKMYAERGYAPQAKSLYDQADAIELGSPAAQESAQQKPPDAEGVTEA
jgi:hypothetical protein